MMLWLCPLLLVSHVACDPKRMTNIDYVAKGYNIFYANPHPANTPGVDPGFNTYAGSEIFVQSYDKGTITGDGRYSVPDGFSLEKNEGCSLDFSSTATFKSKEYTDSLKKSVSSEFGGFGASFTASRDYHTFHEQTTQSNTKSVSSVAECAVYTAGVDQYRLPQYHENFKQAIASLPSTYGDGEKYFNFLDSFGTHAFRSVTMGARYGFSSYFAEEGWKDVVKTGVSVSVAAGYEGKVKAGGKIEDSKEKTQQQTFESKMQDYQEVTLGSKPTTGDAIEWSQQVIDEPMPISYTLMLICDVINNTGVKDNCKKALSAEEYCSKRILTQRGDVTTCQSPSEEACVWTSDCPKAHECTQNTCHDFSSHVQPVNRYWHTEMHSNTFHFAPAWDGETGAGDKIFYALDTQVAGTTPINRYCGDKDKDNTFHPSPAWTQEHNCGSTIFYAFTEQVSGTVAINRYWNDKDHRSTFHPAPEWSDESCAGDHVFYAYPENPLSFGNQSQAVLVV